MDLAKQVGLSPSDLRAAVASGMFDERFYLKTYPDVAEAGIDPFEHYLTFGRFEQRRPSAIFDPLAYAELNPEVAASGMAGLLHYVLVGQAAGAPRSKAETTPPRPALTREIACGTKRLMLSKLGRIKAFVKTLAGSARATPSKVCVYTAVFAG